MSLSMRKTAEMGLASPVPSGTMTSCSNPIRTSRETTRSEPRTSRQMPTTRTTSMSTTCR